MLFLLTCCVLCEEVKQGAAQSVKSAEKRGAAETSSPPLGYTGQGNPLKNYMKDHDK